MKSRVILIAFLIIYFTILPSHAQDTTPASHLSGEIAYIDNGTVTLLDIKHNISYPLPISDYNLRSLAWSPDGRQLAFAWKRQQISLIDADGKNLRQVVNGSYDIVSVAWSPDGASIAFISPIVGTFSYEIYLVTIESGSVRKLAETSDVDSLTWSADGRQIAFTADFGLQRIGIFTLNLETDELRQLSHGGRLPVWSPDGTQIAFVGDNFMLGFHLYVMDVYDNGALPYGELPGDHARQLTANIDVESPLGVMKWSPDGSKIAVTCDSPSICIVEALSGNVLSILQPSDAMYNVTITSLDWSPDGQKIVFAGYFAPDQQIYLVDANGDNFRQLSISTVGGYCDGDCGGDWKDSPVWRP